MSLIKSLLLFVCLLCIYISVVDARCWLDCAVAPYRPLEPYCHLNDDGSSTSCSIDATTSQLIGLPDNDWYKVRLYINVTNSVTGVNIRSRLADYKLQISAFRVFPRVTRLHVRYKRSIVSYSTFSVLPNLRHLYLHNVAFHHFPTFSSLNRQLTYLGIYYYRILSSSGRSFLKNNHVSGLHQLKFLYLSPIDRTTVIPNAFLGLYALTELSIDNMRVTPDPISILSPLRGLKILGIYRAELTDIEFLKQTPWLYQLTRVNFWDNRLTSFASDIFTNYTQLIDLKLSNNRISVIDRANFTKLGYLEGLFLNNNLITTIPPDTFKDMPLLRSIYLGSNPLTALSSRAFEHLSGIEYISLFSSRFHCDCSLQWMSIVKEFGIRFNSPICHTPAEHRGRYTTDASLYTNCTRDLSYECFNSSVVCPRGSYCRDTLDSHLCVCEGERVFSSSLNRCVDLEQLIRDAQGQFVTDPNGYATFVPHTTCPTVVTTVPQSCPTIATQSCPICPTITTQSCPICPTITTQSCPTCPTITTQSCPICPTIATQSCPICPTIATPECLTQPSKSPTP